VEEPPRLFGIALTDRAAASVPFRTSALSRQAPRLAKLQRAFVSIPERTPVSARMSGPVDLFLEVDESAVPRVFFRRWHALTFPFPSRPPLIKASLFFGPAPFNPERTLRTCRSRLLNLVSARSAASLPPPLARFSILSVSTEQLSIPRHSLFSLPVRSLELALVFLLSRALLFATKLRFRTLIPRLFSFLRYTRQPLPPPLFMN